MFILTMSHERSNHCAALHLIRPQNRSDNFSRRRRFHFLRSMIPTRRRRPLVSRKRRFHPRQTHGHIYHVQYYSAKQKQVKRLYEGKYYYSKELIFGLRKHHDRRFRIFRIVIAIFLKQMKNVQIIFLPILILRMESRVSSSSLLFFRLKKRTHSHCSIIQRPA